MARFGQEVGSDANRRNTIKYVSAVGNGRNDDDDDNDADDDDDDVVGAEVESMVVVFAACG